MRVHGGLGESMARAIPISPRDYCKPDGGRWPSANCIPEGSAELVTEVASPSGSGFQ